MMDGEAIVEIRDLAQGATALNELHRGHLYYDHHTKQVIDTQKHDARPFRTTGTVNVFDGASFVAYWLVHADAKSRIYVDPSPTKPAVIGVLNHADGDTTGWGDHRVAIEFRPTPEWTLWVQNDRKGFNQETFANLLEDNLKDIVAPPAADMLEIAKTMSAKTNVNFRSAIRLEDGSTSFVNEQEVSAKAGTTGNLVIPYKFTLGLKPFEGSSLYGVDARLRYRIIDGALTLSYILNRPADVIRDAVNDVVKEIAVGVGEGYILLGRPA